MAQNVTISGDTSVLPKLTPLPSPTPPPYFEAIFKKLDTCNGNRFANFSVENTGNIDFRSAYIRVTDTKAPVKNAAEKILAEINRPSGFPVHREGGLGWVPFVTVATARQIQTCSGLFAKRSGALLMPLQAGGCLYYQPDLRYREGDEKEARKTYSTICSRLIKEGVTFPRPSALIAKQVAAAYPRYFTLLRSIKKAVDPQHIMNTGKLAL